MLIPRFSIRWLLLCTAACAVVALVLMWAMQGKLWAAAIAIALGGLVLVAGLHVLLFGLVWLASFALAWPKSTLQRRTSGAPPFENNE